MAKAKKRKVGWQCYAEPSELQLIKMYDGRIASHKDAVKHYAWLRRTIITRCRIRAHRGSK